MCTCRSISISTYLSISISMHLYVIYLYIYLYVCMHITCRCSICRTTRLATRAAFSVSKVSHIFPYMCTCVTVSIPIYIYLYVHISLMMICLPPQGTPPHHTAAGTAHSAHSTQPALPPHRATPRVEDNTPADAPAPLNRSMLAPFGGQVLHLADNTIGDAGGVLCI